MTAQPVGGGRKNRALAHGYCRCGDSSVGVRMATGADWGRGEDLPHMTISGHNVIMRHVRIAELKSRLSECLRAVRVGETITVLDRETPVAQIVPVRERATLRIRKPAPGTPAPNRVRLPKPLKLNIDVVQFLLEERQGHR